MEIPMRANISKINSVGKAAISGKMEPNIEEIFQEESDQVRGSGNRKKIKKDYLILMTESMTRGRKMALESTNGAMA